MCLQPGPWALQLWPPESLRHAGHVPGLLLLDGCWPWGTWCGRVRCFSSYIALRGHICWALSALPAGPAASASCWQRDEEPVPPFCLVVLWRQCLLKEGASDPSCCGSMLEQLNTRTALLWGGCRVASLIDTSLHSAPLLHVTTGPFNFSMLVALWERDLNLYQTKALLSSWKKHI